MSHLVNLLERVWNCSVSGPPWHACQFMWLNTRMQAQAQGTASVAYLSLRSPRGGWVSLNRARPHVVERQVVGSLPLFQVQRCD